MFNIKNVIIGIGIVIIFGLVLWQGIEAFYPTPQFEDFCQGNKPVEATTQQSCESSGGQWTSYTEPVPIGERKGYCDIYFTCNKELNSALDAHSKVVFIVALIAGIIAFVLGYSLLAVEPVGSALIGGGIWAVFWGSAINWRNFSSVLRFVLLLAALVVLIWFALRINSPKKKGFLGKIGLKKR